MRISWDRKTLKRLEAMDATETIGELQVQEFLRRLKSATTDWEGTCISQGRGNHKYYRVEVRYRHPDFRQRDYKLELKLLGRRGLSNQSAIVVEFTPSYSGRIHIGTKDNLFQEVHEVIKEAEVVLLALTNRDK